MGIFSIFKKEKTKPFNPHEVPLPKMSYDQRKEWERENKQKIVKELLERYESKILEKSHLKVGDTAVVNKYEMFTDSSNSWDSGSAGLIDSARNRTEVDKEPLLVKIKEIYVDTNYAYELLDRLFDDWDETQNGRNVTLNDYLYYFDRCVGLSKYNFNSINVPTPYNSAFGLFLGVKFESEEMNVSWGINAASFIKADSYPGKVTQELWRKAWVMKQEISEAKKKYNRFCEDAERNIRHASPYTHNLTSFRKL